MKRFCSVLVAFALCFGLLQPPKAQAVVAEAGLISSLVGIVMSSMGYTWSANGMNEQGFGDALEDVIVEYLNTEVGGMTIEEWALVGTSVALSGNSTLLIQQGLMQKIMDFADWFTQKFGLDDNSPVDVSGGGNLFSASTTNSYGTLSYPTSLSIVSSGSFITFEIPLDVSGKYVCSKISDYDRYGSPFVFQVDILNANRQTVSPLNVSDLGRTYWSMDDDSHSLATVWNINDDVLALGACVLRMTVVSPSNPYYSKISVGEYSLQQVCSFSRVSDASLSVVKSPVAQNPDIADDGTQAYELTIANLTASDLQELINAAVSQAIAGTLSVEGAVTVNSAVPDNPVVPDAGLLDSILTGVLAIPGAIVDGIVTALQSVFLPSEEKVQALQDEAAVHFPFIGDLQSFGSDFVGVLNDPGGSANNLTTIVDLGKKSDGTYGGAKINLLDASWYLPYKETGDDIIVGICWLVFLWNLYGALPSIIHGGASGLYSVARIEDAQRRRFWEDVE